MCNVSIKLHRSTCTIQEHAKKSTILTGNKSESEIITQLAACLLLLGNLFNGLGFCLVPVGDYHKADIDHVSNFLKGVSIEYGASSQSKHHARFWSYTFENRPHLYVGRSTVNCLNI